MTAWRTHAARLALVAAVSLAACGGGDDANISGTLTNLASGQTVTLQNNAEDDLTLTSNGSFTFSKKLGAKDDYAVTVRVQPSTQICSVTAGSGTVSSSGRDVTDVGVGCVSRTTVLGGTVTGLASGTAVTLINGSVSLAVSVNGAFTFPGLLTIGQSYAVTVATQPSGKNCSVSNGVGTVAADVAIAITVTCI